MEKESAKLKLWMPITIGIIGFVMAFPAGSLLAAINAHRLGDILNKRKYILNGILYLPAALFVGLSYFDWLAGLAWIANILLAYWLYHDTKNELEEYGAEKEIVNERWWKGVLIGASTWVVFGLCFLSFAVTMMMFNSQ